MNYVSTSTFTSKLDPTVTFRLRKMSHKRRLQFNAVAAPDLMKMTDLQRKIWPLQEQLKAAEDLAKATPCVCGHPEDQHEPSGRCKVPQCQCRIPQDAPYEEFTVALQELILHRKDVINPAYLRWGVVTVDGLTIDGEPATVETLISDGPEPLIEEVALEIERLTRLSNDEIMGFNSPTTSAAAVDGQNQTTSAANAA